MKIIINKKEKKADIYVLGKDGLYTWDGEDWHLETPVVNRIDFFDKSKEQLKKHPDYLDLDELFKI